MHIDTKPQALKYEHYLRFIWSGAVQRILLISGHICTGKSDLTAALAETYGFAILKTSEYIRNLPSAKDDRISLQKLGDELDQQTDGKWVLDCINDYLKKNPNAERIAVDAVRISQQVNHVREKYGSRVSHVHLTAPPQVLEQRFNERKKNRPGDSSLSYGDANLNKNEREIELLAEEADTVVDTERTTTSDVLVRVACRMGLHAPTGCFVDVIVGGQYGSEGKGQVAAYLAREYDVHVRVGGPNAGHTVHSDSGKFVYHHLPSGSRDTKSLILIGPGAVIDPNKFLDEIKRADIDPKRVKLDPQAMIIEELDLKAEDTLMRVMGSTRQGVGAASARKIMGRDGSAKLARDIPELRHLIGSTRDLLEDAYAHGRSILLEGTQGSGLSLHHGPYPYVTSRDTTVAGCLAETGISPTRVRRVIMVVRPYPIRVANPDEAGKTSGSFKREITADIIAQRSGLNAEEIKKAERTSTTNRPRRFGEFEWDQFRSACMLNAPTDIVLSFADYINADNRKARRFDQLNGETIRFIEELERIAKAPVSLINTCAEKRSVIDRRDWIPSSKYWVKA